MRVTPAFLFLFCVWFAPVFASADALPAAADIRDRAAAATGPEPENLRETIVGTGTLGDTKRVTYRLGKDVRRQFEGYGDTNSGTYRGESWTLHGNGLITVDADDPGREVKEAIVTTVSRVTKPADAYVVAELNAHGAGRRSYYDPATYRLFRTEDVDATETRVTTYDDFAPFGARMLAKRWTITSPQAHFEMRYVRTEYRVGVVTAADVAEPVTKRMLVEFPPGVRQVDLPAHTVRNAVFVRVGIGSKEADFELDTGAGGIFIDTAFARELGLSLGNASSTVTAGRYTSYTANVPELRIGVLRMHDINVYVGPLPVAQGAGTVRPVGLLGFDFLAQLGVTIDYQNEIVRVVPAEDYVPPTAPRTSALPIRLGAGVPMVTIAVSDAVAERMIVDTGCSCQLEFFDYFTRRYPDAFRDDVGAVRGFGVGGSVNGEMFRLHEVVLGPAHFASLLGLRLPPSSYLYEADGLLGNQLLTFFTVGLDYTRGQIYITPNAFGQRGMIRRPAH